MRFRREIVGLAATIAVAVAGSIACESDIAEDDGSGTGTGATGGSGGGQGGVGGGGGQLAACQPTDPICYGNRPPESPGSECLATVDNTTADRVQLRQTWNRVVAPVGNTTPTVYSILKQRAQIRLPECYMTGEGGYIQLTDWDRSNADITQQTIRTGYASYSRQPPTGAPTGASLVNDGLCMVQWSYTFNSPLPADPFPDTDLARWQDTATPEANRPLPQPWQIEPVTASRVADDFEIADLRGTVPAGSGRIFIDETTGYLHSYVPLAYVSVLDNRSGGLAVPIREVEVRTQFNDNSFNCIGRFRADVMTQAQNCDSPSDQDNPPWGCADDATCPPAGVSDATGAGLGPSYTRGYFLIVDLERVWSTTLQSTLCVSYPGDAKSVTDGWSNPGAWGKNCRGSPQWDPTLPDDAGLPMGDWCSRENGPATATCHDAYLSESYSTGQAFKIQDDACAL